jgi:hypothetical protein
MDILQISSRILIILSMSLSYFINIHLFEANFGAVVDQHSVENVTGPTPDTVNSYQGVESETS